MTHPAQEPKSYDTNPFGGDVPTAYGIGKWLLSAREEGATHMIVVCDTFDFDDYPVHVMPDQDVHKVIADYRSQTMREVMEVYWMDGDLDQQLDMPRSFTYGPKDE